jgi:hypothetical protein
MTCEKRGRRPRVQPRRLIDTPSLRREGAKRRDSRAASVPFRLLHTKFAAIRPVSWPRGAGRVSILAALARLGTACEYARPVNLEVVRRRGGRFPRLTVLRPRGKPRIERLKTARRRSRRSRRSRRTRPRDSFAKSGAISGDAIRKTYRRPPVLQFHHANRGGRRGDVRRIPVNGAHVSSKPPDSIRCRGARRRLAGDRTGGPSQWWSSERRAVCVIPPGPSRPRGGAARGVTGALEQAIDSAVTSTPAAGSIADLAGDRDRRARRRPPKPRPPKPRPPKPRPPKPRPPKPRPPKPRPPKPRPPKPKPPTRDSAGEGLSRRRHPPISAPRSETRSRPEARARKALAFSGRFR